MFERHAWPYLAMPSNSVEAPLQPLADNLEANVQFTCQGVRGSVVTSIPKTTRIASDSELRHANL